MTQIDPKSIRRGRRPQRLRLAPFKILSLLLYGDYPWLQPDAEGSLTLRLSSMARDMRVSRERLREHLRWLHEWGYLKRVEFDHGSATIRLASPPNLDAVYGKERQAALKAIQKQDVLRQILEAGDEVD